MSAMGSHSSNTDETTDQYLARVIDVQIVDDDMLVGTIQLNIHPMAVASAMFVLAEFVHEVVRQVEDQSQIPYGYLGAKFSGYRSASMRRYRKQLELEWERNNPFDTES